VAVQGCTGWRQEGSRNCHEFAEQNVTTAFDYAQKLVRAKDPEALLAFYGDFMNAQMRMFREHSTTVGDIASGGILLSAWYRPNRGHSGSI
jgi:hypothetical protein